MTTTTESFSGTSPYDGVTGRTALSGPISISDQERRDAVAYLRRRDALDLAPYFGLQEVPE